MESALSLYYSPLPIAPLRLSPGAIRAVRESRVHLRSSHGSLCLANSSSTHPVARSFGRVNCMLDNFRVSSKNEDESDSKVVRGMAGISVIMACVLGTFSFGNMMNPKCVTAYAFSQTNPSASDVPRPKGLPGGEDALESFLKTMNYCSPTAPQLDDLSENSLKQLKLYVVGRSRSGKSRDDLSKALETEYNKWKAQLQKKHGKQFKELPDHYLKLACIELLILDGKYQEARRQLDQFISRQIGSMPNEDQKIEKLTGDPFSIFKSEIILYKAIVHTKLGDNVTAAKWRNAMESEGLRSEAFWLEAFAKLP